MSTLEALENLVNALPRSAPAIAQFLIDRGVRGVRDQEHCCPLSRWIRTELEVPYVESDCGVITAWDEKGNVYSVTTPFPAMRFIVEFDSEDKYPELEDDAGETDEESWGHTHRGL